MICVNSVKVTPESVTLKAGQWYYNARAEVCPLDAECRSVRWYSNNTSVATVNATTGYIYAVKAGSAKIYAEATDGSGEKDYITVNVTSGPIYVDSVTLSRTSISMEEGDSYTLNANVFPSNADNRTIAWSSSNENIAEVSNGTITAKTAGTAYIYARATDGSEKYAQCQVTVTEEVLVTSVSVSPARKTMTVGDTAYLHEIVCPPDADNKEVVWSSSDLSVVTVNYTSGLIFALKAGIADVYATAKDGSGISGVCEITVNPPVGVQSVQVSPTTLILDIDETAVLEVTVEPADAADKSIAWCSSNEEVVSVDNETGQIQARQLGQANIYAVSQDNNEKFGVCFVYCDAYQYELEHTFKFSKDIALLIRSIYDKVDNISLEYEGDWFRAWKCARLLGGICYGNASADYFEQLKWRETAGYAFDELPGLPLPENQEEHYFVETLGYTIEEYTALTDAIINQHNDASTPDFAHMQISLAARLAYKIDTDGLFADIIGLATNDTISYLAGWLGDATITNDNGLTSFGDDDYCADLDAENIYRLQISLTGRSAVYAINSYYESISSENTRANVFLGYINYETVKEKICSQLNIDNNEEGMNIIRNSYPDTYNFLCSLRDGLHHLAEY